MTKTIEQVVMPASVAEIMRRLDEGALDVDAVIPLFGDERSSETLHIGVEEQGIGLLRFDDAGTCNALTRGGCEGFRRSLAALAERPDVRVVVVTGSHGWFASGSPPEAAWAIEALLRAPLPTVAALSGHGMGAGLLLGLAADFPLLVEHGIYGVTAMERHELPMGGTRALLARACGDLLAAEMMWTGRRYDGRELAERRAPLEILRGDEIMDRALELARQIARHPREELRRMKKRLGQDRLAEFMRGQSSEPQAQKGR